MSPIKFPGELKSAIIDYLDDRNDVLSLALTSRDFCVLCIPDVLAWREVHIRSIDVPDLWQHIADSAIHARQIRCLVVGVGKGAHLLRRRPCQVPRLPAPFIDAPEVWICSSSDDTEYLEEEDEHEEANPHGYAETVTALFVAALHKMENLRAITIGGHTFPAGSVDTIWTTIISSCKHLQEITVPPLCEEDAFPGVMITSAPVSKALHARTS